MKYGEIILNEKLLQAALKLPLQASVMISLLVYKSDFTRALAEFETRRQSIVNDESADEQTKRKAVEELVESECENFAPCKVRLDTLECVIEAAIKQGKVNVMGKDVEVAEFAEAFYHNLVEE